MDLRERKRERVKCENGQQDERERENGRRERKRISFEQNVCKVRERELAHHEASIGAGDRSKHQLESCSRKQAKDSNGCADPEREGKKCSQAVSRRSSHQPLLRRYNPTPRSSLPARKASASLAACHPRHVASLGRRSNQQEQRCSRGSCRELKGSKLHDHTRAGEGS